MGQCISLPPLSLPIPDCRPVGLPQYNSTQISHLCIDVLYIDASSARRQEMMGALRYHNICTMCCSSGGNALSWLAQPTHTTSIVIIHQSVRDMNLPTLGTRIHELCPSIILVGILHEMNEQIVRACITSKLLNLFITKSLPGPIIPFIVEQITTIRQITQHNIKHITFHPNKVWT